MGRHAWLIMAHNQFDLLKKLLKALDNKDGDIFIHIDKKVEFDKNDLEMSLFKSRCYFTKSVEVNWGGYSQIEAELLLLETAINTNHYDFYHLLTGVDYPLKKIEEIQGFFDANRDYEFISSMEISKKQIERCKYYYFLQDCMGINSNKSVGKVFRRISLGIQKAFHICRNKDIDSWYIGSAYFDISEECAKYILDKKEEIRKRFSHTRCADEIFLQTMYYKLPVSVRKSVFQSHRSHEYIQSIYLDVLRAIDWTRGTPYVWKTEEDYEILKSSGCLFARKFDYEKYPQIIDKLEKDITM